MRYFSGSALCAGLALWGVTLTGCGYLPSEMDGKPKAAEAKPQDASAEVFNHVASCGARAKGYKLLPFNDLYVTTDDPRFPFQRASNLPRNFDVRAYVWGFQSCESLSDCNGGDHYWLIGRGPGDDFSTWVVTPQFPRITISSSCRNTLKVGERYRFSFSNGQLTGFSRN
ncbi:hypothetical protein [Microbulbifer agarilyticus]|uniref:hypothetical protein n=1 Tax=Microbulbifer agarilyticus TaxID=260552 RepID=UPI001CD658CA|nr:hypothetical protein [Microbulbifer agarilyticus]MCA0894548.1 hypothetical protein [Microbulbifer agarilyticus]